MASTQSRPTIVLITGGNTGLGFEIAKSLFSRRGPETYHIILGARGPLSRAEEAISKLNSLFPASTSLDASNVATPLSIDITSDESIHSAFDTVSSTPGLGCIDVLVNNAGAYFDLAIQSGRLTPREAFAQTWDVNVTGTHLFTEKFVPLLLSNPPTISEGKEEKGKVKRLIFLTSGMSSITESASGTYPRYTNPPPGWPKPPLNLGFGTSPYPGIAYRSSKAGLNMLVTEWSRVLKNDSVKVFNISPGFLDTGLGRDRITGEEIPLSKMGALDPQVGGEFLADVVAGKRDEQAWPVRTLKRDAEQPW